MTVRIRQAQRTDIKAIAQMLRALGWFPHLNSEPHEATKKRIARHLRLCDSEDSHSVYVAENATREVVGYGSVHWLPTLFLAGPEGYVSELFIEESARGQGAGTHLLEAIQKEARERGCSRLIVLNNRHRQSYRRGFYRKCGWEERPDAANFVYRLS
jgi:GNAT superfamily N-acetyltransferase